MICKANDCSKAGDSQKTRNRLITMINYLNRPSKCDEKMSLKGRDARLNLWSIVWSILMTIVALCLYFRPTCPYRSFQGGSPLFNDGSCWCGEDGTKLHVIYYTMPSDTRNISTYV